MPASTIGTGHADECARSLDELRWGRTRAGTYSFGVNMREWILALAPCAVVECFVIYPAKFHELLGWILSFAWTHPRNKLP